MGITSVSSREFKQDVSRVKRAAVNVLLTSAGFFNPDYVIHRYCRLSVFGYNSKHF